MRARAAKPSRDEQRRGGRREHERDRSRLPSTGAPATVTAARTASKPSSARAGGLPSARRGRAVEGGQREPAVQRGERPEGGGRDHRAGDEVGRRRPERVAEQQLLQPRRRRGRERQQRPRAEQRADGDCHADVGAEARSRAGQPDRERGGAATPPAAPSTSGSPASAASTSPGSSPWLSDSAAKRLAVQEHPHAERAAGGAEQRELEQRPAHERLVKGSVSQRHPCVVVRVVVEPDGGAVAEQDQLGAVGALQRLGREHGGGGAEPALLAVQAQHVVVRARERDVVGGDEQRAALARSSANSASMRAALTASTPESGSSSSSTRASCTSARAISTRWRWPPDSVAEAARGAVGEADAASAARARSRSRAAEAPPPRRAGVGAHQRDVERAGREVRAAPGRSAARRPARPCTSTVPRCCGSSPSSARNSVVLPPPLGPSTATRRPGATSKATSRSASVPGA